MRKKLLSLFMLMFTLGAFSQVINDTRLEDRRAGYQINPSYKGGAFLIYDCAGDFYACVDEDSSNLCLEKRKASMEKNDVRFPCAPLKKFADKESCLIRNYEVMEEGLLKRFCYPKN